MINPEDPAEIQIRKLRKINEALMARVERATDISGSAFALFQTAISLEGEVRARTQDLQGALDELSESNARLEQAHAEAEAANLSKTRFLAAASHDLLQPMNAAKLFISILGEMSLEPAQAEVVTRLSGAFNSIETLLHALLEISRLDAGRAEYALTDFPLSAVLEQLEQDFKPLAAAKGLRLRVRPSAFRIRSDPRYFRRIAQNLVANAVNSRPPLVMRSAPWHE